MKKKISPFLIVLSLLVASCSDGGRTSALSGAFLDLVIQSFELTTEQESLTETPVLSWEIRQTIESIQFFEISIWKSSDSSVVLDWTVVAADQRSFQTNSGVSFEDEESYFALIRVTNSNDKKSDEIRVNVSGQNFWTVNLTQESAASQKMSSGGSHTCLITDAGGLKCWGRNTSGQLGDGTTNNSSTPVDVIGLGGTVTQVSAGSAHTCAIVNGGAKCWGEGLNGRLGNGAILDQTSPVDVTGLGTNVSQIAAGNDHTCARLSNGSLKCWGAGASGQRGDEDTGNNEQTTPVDVTGVSSGATDIVSGGGFSCAVINGGAKCWGRNILGVLGVGDTADRDAPTQVVGFTSGVDFMATGAGNTTACLVASGNLSCWGNNSSGQLGQGSADFGNHHTPESVGGVSSIVDVSIDSSGVCIVNESGALFCWGSDSSGILGNGPGDTSTHTSPSEILTSASQVSEISAGSSHRCANVNSVIKCWGNGAYGKIGDGTFVSKDVPTDVTF